MKEVRKSSYDSRLEKEALKLMGFTDTVEMGETIYTQLEEVIQKKREI